MVCTNCIFFFARKKCKKIINFFLDVMEFNLPLLGCNGAPQYGNPRSHQWFYQWEQKGEYTMRFFIEPVILAVNYAKFLGYKNIIMVFIFFRRNFYGIFLGNFVYEN